MTSIIVATVHDDYTVAFVGTSQGHLKKVRVIFLKNLCPNIKEVAIEF